MSKLFYDTSALLELNDDLTNVVISSLSINELENIKSSNNKTEDIRYKARKAVRAIERDNPYVEIFQSDCLTTLENRDVELTNDNKIIACAKNYENYNSNGDKITFVSNDYLQRLIAHDIFELEVDSVHQQKELYKGYKNVSLSDEELANFYEHLNVNKFELNINEYVIINTQDGQSDIYRWDGETHCSILTKSFKSRMFGQIKPLDDIQKCAFDSIWNNDITLLYGRSGSGKTTLPIAYIMQGLETQKINKCHCIFHYEPLKNARTLGFVKGEQKEKKLNTSSLGNILISKLGDESVISSMISNGSLNILGTYEIRGFEAKENDLIYVTECQNLDAYTLKTILQRAKQGCKIILEGDIIEQTDINRESGIWKMIDVFKGYNGFGCIKLKNNYRSEISELADKL